MKVAVYCSAKDVIPEAYLRLGDMLGTWLAEQGHTLVYGGATGGLMTRVSNAVAQMGGEVVGVVPQRIISAGRMATNCSVLHVVGTMAERKQMMRVLADCFVCLPGSYGTLDEMFDVIASGTVGEHRKPIVVLNYEGFYEGLKEQARKMHEHSFLPTNEVYAPMYVETIEELQEALQHIEAKIRR